MTIQAGIPATPPRRRLTRKQRRLVVRVAVHHAQVVQPKCGVRAVPHGPREAKRRVELKTPRPATPLDKRRCRVRYARRSCRHARHVQRCGYGHLCRQAHAQRHVAARHVQRLAEGHKDALRIGA